MDKFLDNKRKEIDAIDKEIIELLNKRFEVTNSVGTYKKDNAINVENKNRENDIIKNIKSNNNINVKSDIITLYKLIFKLSKENQNKILEEK